MTRAFTGRTIGLAAAAIALFVGSGLAQQAMSHEHTAPPAAASPGTQAGSQDQMGDNMMARRHRMMADMHASEQKLDELVATMNAARGEERIDAMAAVITELVARHKSMGAGMMSMPGSMMSMPRGMTPMPDDKK